MERLYARALGAAAAIVAYSEHEADVLAEMAPASGAQRRPSSSCRSASTSRRSGRRARSSDVDVVSIGADPHRDFELLLDGRAGAAGDELPRRHDARSGALARRPAEQRLRRDRPAVRRDAPPARARPRRRAARARQQLLGRDDGAPPGDGARASRSSSRGRRRSRRATGSRTERTCDSSRPGTRPPSAARSAEVLRDDERARALGARARATVEARPHLGPVRREAGRRARRGCRTR